MIKYGIRVSVAVICIFVVLLIGTTLSKDKVQQQNILTVVIPHHNFVKAVRLDFWQRVISDSKITPGEIEKIIIIGPNHFGNKQNAVTYDEDSWITHDGSLGNFFKRPDYFPNHYILDSKTVKKDHAISNLVSEIHDLFPNAEFVPFLIGTQLNFTRLTPLMNYINDACNRNCILVASVDFVHETTIEVASEIDKNTIKLLQNKTIDESSFNQGDIIEVDSPASLYVIQEFARMKQLDWRFYFNTNSVLGNTETMENTSHIFGAYMK